MSLFEVYGSDNQRRMYTDDASCIYDSSTLTNLAQAGCYFKLNGKRATKSQVLEVSGAAPREPASTKFERMMAAATQSRAVRCVDTGKVYNTQSEAAKDLGIDSAQVSDSIKTGKRRSGYLFERV